MGKIIITGAGRSGTTFLLQLLTRLGFDTGYEPYKEPYNPKVRAGCEHHLEFDLSGPPGEARTIADAAPRVLKSPEWGLIMKGFIRAGIIEVDYCIIPLRDLDEAAQSRLDVQLEWQVCPTDDYAYRLMDQASVHALAFGRAVEACLICGIPYSIIMFPQMVQDEGYCYRKLSEGLDIEEGKFHEVYRELARPGQVVWRA